MRNLNRFLRADWLLAVVLALAAVNIVQAAPGSAGVPQKLRIKELTVNPGPVTVTGDLDVSGTITGGTFAGLGTMATQDSTAVAITGGTINGTTLGATTPAAAAVSELTTSEVVTASGPIYLRKSTGGETLASFTPDGGVSLLHDNALRFSTGATGYSLWGLGSLVNAAGDETLASFTPDGAVNLYYNNVVRLSTSSGGAAVAGSLSVTSSATSSVSFSAPALYTSGNAGVARSGSSAGGLFLSGYDSGSPAQIFLGGTTGGTPFVADVRSSLVTLENIAQTETLATFAENGAATLYYDNAAKLATDASGAVVTGRVESGQLWSTIATGTAPLTVASTTLVTNLNADLLDGLSSGAFPTLAAGGNFTVAPTIASGTIWHSGNDGAGSGLDADLLDGVSSASFARVDSATDFTTAPTINGAAIVTVGGSGQGQQAYVYRYDTTAGGACNEQFDPNGWSCTRDDTGDITLTHNFGTTNYTCVGTGWDSSRVVYFSSLQANTILVTVENLASSPVDDPATVVCYK